MGAHAAAMHLVPRHGNPAAAHLARLFLDWIAPKRRLRFERPIAGPGLVRTVLSPAVARPAHSPAPCMPAPRLRKAVVALAAVIAVAIVTTQR